MSLIHLTENERKALILGISNAEKLPSYEVSGQLIRYCEARGINPVIAYCICNMQYADDDHRVVNNTIDIRKLLDNPRHSDLKGIRNVLIELRVQQNIIIPSALSGYIKYLEHIRNKEISRLTSDL